MITLGSIVWESTAFFLLFVFFFLGDAFFAVSLDVAGVFADVAFFFFFAGTFTFFF